MPPSLAPSGHGLGGHEHSNSTGSPTTGTTPTSAAEFHGSSSPSPIGSPPSKATAEGSGPPEDKK